MARVVSPDRVLSAPVSLASDFYREEFIRHRECLKRQREYLSERAITDADPHWLSCWDISNNCARRTVRTS